MIEMSHPNNWRGLQDNVCLILNECGFQAESPKKLSIVRDQVEVDVYAVSKDSCPKISYICECKHWNKRVPQEVVHSVRTVVNDAGANIGLIISLKGFQSGAIKAAENTNIRLLSWDNFQETFLERWYRTYFIPKLYEISGPLVEYTEPINSRIQREAAQLNREKFDQFLSLREKYKPLAFFAISLYSPTLYGKVVTPMPLSQLVQLKKLGENFFFPDEVLNATAYRQLLIALCDAIETATKEFNKVFGDIT